MYALWERVKLDTVQIGNELEKPIYDFLRNQQKAGEYLIGTIPPDRCTVRWKPKYYSKERGGDIEFDVSIEVRREENLDPQSTIIFECKNYSGGVPADKIREFSDKLSEIGRHDTKGFIVITSRLQSGAEKIARNRKLGIIKYDPNGLEYLAERRFKDNLKSKHAKAALFGSTNRIRSLKFAATYSGKYFDNCRHLLTEAVGEKLDKSEIQILSKAQFPFLSTDDIESSTNKLLSLVNYHDGPVDLAQICAELSIDLVQLTEANVNQDEDELLGRADFPNKQIVIYAHGNRQRERFTLAHEIGHFYLNHDKFLRSETTVHQDLVVDEQETTGSLINRMEHQANMFASQLLLPKINLANKICKLRTELDIRDRGHGYIFVDNQPQNLSNYYLLLERTSQFFDTSSQAIEIRLKNLGFVTDNRKQPENFTAKFKLPWPN